MRILITGTASGIGKAAAEYFLQQGHRVWGLDLQPAAIRHPDYCHLQADVRKPESLPELPEAQSPEILVCSAGVQNSGEDIEVNLRGVIRTVEKYAAGSACIRAVTIVGSASAHTGAEFPEYAASKGGLLAYTKNVANRLAPHAICNSIDPGGVLTELNRPVMDDPALWAQIMALTPLKRWATPQEIAEWIYFVSVTNRFMTGQNLLIDGGEAGKTDFIWPE